MTHDPRTQLPDDIVAALGDDAERERVRELWSALGVAAPRTVSDDATRSAMWTAIASATDVDAAASSPAVTLGNAAVVDVSATAPDATAPARASVSPISRIRRRGLRWPVPLALAASMLLAVGYVARPGEWQEITAPRAQTSQITLPDGSAVDLDAGASLRFRRGFRGWGGRSRVRQVELRGAAYFAVARDGRAFAVRTYNAEVRVLGTAFSVDAREADSAGTRVEVTEGRVQVQGADASLAVELGVGERSTVSHAARAPDEAIAVSVERIAPWRRGGFVALDEPLAHVMRSLERRFDVTISIADTAVSARRVSLYYPATVSLERILSDLATTQELRWERRVNGYVIE